jgi:hypothetical protein
MTRCGSVVPYFGSKVGPCSLPFAAGSSVNPCAHFPSSLGRKIDRDCPDSFLDPRSRVGNRRPTGPIAAARDEKPGQPRRRHARPPLKVRVAPYRNDRHSEGKGLGRTDGSCPVAENREGFRRESGQLHAHGRASTTLQLHGFRSQPARRRLRLIDRQSWFCRDPLILRTRAASECPLSGTDRDAESPGADNRFGRNRG